MILVDPEPLRALPGSLRTPQDAAGAPPEGSLDAPDAQSLRTLPQREVVQLQHVAATLRPASNIAVPKRVL